MKETQNRWLKLPKPAREGTDGIPQRNFKLSEVKNVFEELDQWIRRKLRCILWRQWKRPKTREEKLRKRGLDRYTAWKSANNGHGAWWNSGAKHMNIAFPKKYFDDLKLASMLDMETRFA